MKLLYVGMISGNTGPANVNRDLISNWACEDDVRFLESSTKLGQFAEGLKKGMGCDAVIFSQNSMVDVVLHAFFRTLGKVCVCFNHGYAPMENIVNGGGIPERRMDAIKRHMQTADAVVANSELQMRLLEKELRPFFGHLTFADLGTDPFEQAPTERTNPRPVIAVSAIMYASGDL